MAWTAFPTWTVGQVSLASDWNTYVAANMNFLATPPACRVFLSTNGTSAAAGYTNLVFDHDLYDNYSAYTSGTYTVPVAGSYFVTAAISYTGGTTTDVYSVYIFVNSASWAQGSGGQESATTGFAEMQVSDCTTQLTVGATIQTVYYTQTSVTIEGAFSATYMSLFKFSN